MTQTSPLQLNHRAQFEKNVTRALIAGAIAGTVGLICYGSKFEAFFQWCMASGAVFAFSGGDRFDRWVVRGLGGLLPFGALLLPGAIGSVLCGGITAALLMVATVDARGSEATVAQRRPGAFSFGLAIALGAALFPIGIGVANELAHRIAYAGAPWLIAMPFAGAAAALFISFASLPSHLLLQEDPVEARGGELLLKLEGELSESVSQMLGAYRHCGDLLAELPREPARKELAQTLSKAVNEALELAEHWRSVEAQLDSGAKDELEAQHRDLVATAQNAKDELARKQLELAASSLQEELANLELVATGRERALAKLKALSAQLGRTRVSLLGLRAAQTQVKGADLLALSRKVQALSSLESTRGELHAAVATGAELDQLEAAKAARIRA